MGGLEFLSPAWLYAAPGLLGALVLLYFLKLKRREVTIASTYLWRAALDDLRVNSPLQRLRMNLLLLLQLLALALLVLALARPVSSLGGLQGTDSILLVDVSASMQATDGGGLLTGATRFERAREEARRVIEDLSYGDRACVIAFADDVRVLTDMTDSKALLRRAVEDLAPTDRPTRLADALHRVRALVDAAEREVELWVFSDGRVGDLSEVALEGAVDLRYVRLGEAEANAGFVGVQATQASGLGEVTRVLATVQNGGPAELTCGVDLLVDDRLTDSREVTVGPGGAASVSFEAPLLDETAPARRVRLVLDHGEAGKDALPADDVGHAVLRPPEKVRLLLVTGGNLFLHRALSADPLVAKTPRGDVPLMSPEDFAALQDAKDYDLIVLDRVTPERLPAGSYLVFGTRPPFQGFEDRGQVEDVEVLDWDETHPAARFVNFATLVLPTARRFEVRDGDKVVVRGTHGPLIVDARDGDRRALVCAFDLMALPIEGAWTFDPSFPIFLANVVRALGGGARDAWASLVRTGQTAKLRLPPGAARARIDPPGDAPPYDLTVVPGDQALHVTALDRAGVYAATFYGADGAQPLRTELFAANLASPEEGVIAPAETLEVAGRTVVGTPEAVESNKDVWKLVALAALLFVMIEWWVYNRRVYL